MFLEGPLQKCGCNCDNNSCCPINGVIFSIIHLLIISYVAGVIRSAFQPMIDETNAQDFEVDEIKFDAEAYFRFGAGLIITFLVYSLTVVLMLALLFCIKGQDAAVTVQPVVAQAVLAQPVQPASTAQPLPVLAQPVIQAATSPPPGVAVGVAQPQ